MTLGGVSNQDPSGTHRSKWSFWAKSCQSLPAALAVSKVAQILWRMDTGTLKALGPVWAVTVQSVCIKNGTGSLSPWQDRTEEQHQRQVQQLQLEEALLGQNLSHSMFTTLT